MRSLSFLSQTLSSIYLIERLIREREGKKGERERERMRERGKKRRDRDREREREKGERWVVKLYFYQYILISECTV